jgi:DNA-binding transcriptional LysR family regulator
MVMAGESLPRLARLDLNLLTVFRALDEMRNVTRAARALGVSQPAVSHALGRLRSALGDPMFVRTPKGMVLTPRAEALAPAIREMLARVESEVLDGGVFQPTTLVRTFRIRTTDFIEALLAPALLERLGLAAPKSSLSFVSTELRLPKEALASGACDLAIAGAYREVPDGFYQQRLFVDRFGGAVRAGHPRLGGRRRVTLEAYCRESHVLIAPGGELHGVIDRALGRMGRERRVVLGASGFLAGAFVAARTNSVITAPSRLLALVAEAVPLRRFDPPVPLADVKVVQVWHARNHQDPAHRWFRDCVSEALR